MARKLAMVEADLERAEERAEQGEKYVVYLEFPSVMWTCLIVPSVRFPIVDSNRLLLTLIYVFFRSCCLSFFSCLITRTFFADAEQAQTIYISCIN